MKKPFYPDVLARDAVTGALVVTSLVALAVWLPRELGPAADPTNSNTNPRPEWYFLFLFEALKHVPGRFEGLAAVIAPTLALVALALLPFLDRGPRRHPLDRPALATAGIIALAGFALLTWKGAHSPLTSPTLEIDPTVVSGRDLFRELRCIDCHSVAGRGGTVGPDLSDAVRRHDRDWLERHFSDPRALVPGSKMPRYDLSTGEKDELIAYLEALAGMGPYSPTAVQLFRDNCNDCHSLRGVGNATVPKSDRGPDLSAIGCLRDRTWLLGYVLDPTKYLADSKMDGFKDSLGDADVDEIAKFLTAQRRDCIAP